MRIALDTNRYAALMRGDRELARQLEDAEWIGMPFVVLGELRAGFAAGRKRSENERTLARFLAEKGVRVLWPSDATTRIYATVHRRLRAAGTPIPSNDLWIAALTLEHESALATADDHFRRIPDLLVLSPS